MQMRYALTEATAPAAEPLSTAEAKAHLRVDVADDDDLIDRIIGAARRQAETFTGRALIGQTWDLDLDCFPGWTIDVPKPPLQSVSQIEYLDADGVSQVLSSSLYRVDARRQPGRITPAYGEVWPVTRGTTNAVTVRFVAGYGAAGSDVPEDIRQAMLLIVGDLYEHREETITGTIVGRIPRSASALLHPYKVYSV
tara:strand:+ start:3717 stop:4304 length:588 start_codon:yes stop_codon:yes gene_type:complete